jgi:N utilization substance protein B
MTVRPSQADDRTPALGLGRRTQARALALQALCVFDAVGDSFREQLAAFLSDTVGRVESGLDLDLPPESLSFARKLADGAWARRSALDAELDQAAPAWTVSRMAPVDRSLLRLALFELLEMPETPPSVVINEAIELAKRFGHADSPRFVNGVLDKLWKRIAPAGDPADQTPDSLPPPP